MNRQIARNSIFLIVAVAFGGTLWAQPAFETIHVFKGSGDGDSPRAGLVLDSSGNAYGVTLYGGASNNGAVYQFVPVSGTENWTESVIYSFGAAPDGMNPAGTLIVGPGGVLYGTTIGGGSANAGTVFQLAPPAIPGGLWTETILYSFAGAPDGAAPHAGLLMGTAGELFGTTAYGGNVSTSCPTGCGTIFSLTPPAGPGDWTEVLLHSFSGSDGANPYASLTSASGGMYGTTANGANGFGEIFRIPSAGGFQVIYKFLGGKDGANPYAALAASTKETLYGTARNGGSASMGTVFSVTPHGVLTTLHSFAGAADGANPVAGVLLDGEVLYGAASLGGSHDDGTLFRVHVNSPATSFKVLHNFNGKSQSANPLSTPILALSQALLGTTEPAQTLDAFPNAAGGGSGYVYCTKNPPACGN